MLTTDRGRDAVRSAVETMNSVQSHRGPDDRGVLVEQVTGRCLLGFSHVRLAINDLTPAGHQPMESPCGRYVLVYNGEVYNFPELASELRPDSILEVSGGDTAVVLAALARWGTAAFSRFNGMWAIAFLDRQARKLIVSRDRLGVKPLYWHHDGGTLLFASEIKAILAVSGRRFKADPRVVGAYLVHSLTNTSSETFFEGIQEVPAGAAAEVALDADELPQPDFRRFWHHPFAHDGSARPPAIDPLAFKDLVLDAVRIRLRSDVPVAVLLSGGLDSSTVLAAASATGGPDGLNALSVVSDDPASNEEPFIDAMTAWVGCNVEKINVSFDPIRLLDELEDVVWFADQPVGGMSAVAHRQLMSKARERGYTVLLTGQGADEQLGGYNKFFYFYLMESLRQGRFVQAGFMLLRSLLLGTMTAEFSWEEARRYIAFIRDRDKKGFTGPALAGFKPLDVGMSDSYSSREFLDITRFSIPMLLHYEDRMSMSVGREMRVPFLDYRIVEHLASVPAESKLRDGWSKHYLRQAIEGLVPDPIRWRKDKKGFNLPERAWARSDFRERFHAMFRKEMASVELGLVKAAAPLRLYSDFLRGDTTVTYKTIFNIYCLEVWTRRYERYLR